jgi:hypothetical protein
MSDSNSVDELTRKFSGLIALRVLELQESGKFSPGGIYSTLSRAGLSNAEIGQIVGKPASDVSSYIAIYNKRNNKQKKKKGEM